MSGRVSGPATNRSVGGLRDRLLRSVRRHCPAWLADQAEDITQVAVMRVLAMPAYTHDPERLTPAYLDRVAYGCTIDEIRRRRARTAEVEDPAAERADEKACDPERRAEADQIGRGIFDCLDTLVPPRRRAVTLHLVGHTAPQIGNLLGWSVKKTESLIYRGLTNLRRCLENKGLTP